MTTFPLFLPTTSRSDSFSGSLQFKSVLEPRSPRRLAPCAFSPLPSIIASPVCSPTASLSSQNQLESTCSHIFLPSSTPTWISTPPTPPSKSVRRSNTTSPRRSLSKSVSPSASFPASMFTHGNRLANGLNPRKLKRSNSLPTLMPSLLDFSYMLPAFTEEDIVQSPKTISPQYFDSSFDVTYSILDGKDGPEHAHKAIFRLSNDHFVTGDEDDATCNRINECSPEGITPDGSWSDHSIEDMWEAERKKDALRKFHALKELLATEVGYLADLKALVTVYLRNLPTLAARPLTTSSTFGRASSSFASGPWMHSYAQLQAAAVTSSSTFPETQHVSASGSVMSKESARISSRYIFSDAELESLTRNAEEILQLHEQFVRELRALLEPLGIAMERDDEDTGLGHVDQINAAIRTVSTKFATEASRFTAYQSFCAGHPEAINVIRKASQHYPIEMEAFEQRCSTMVFDMVEAGTKPASEPKPTHSVEFDIPQGQPQTLAVDDRKRAVSSCSLDGAARTLRSRPSILMTKDSVVFPTEFRREKAAPRIAFMDYMIKPVQRICKYPLLLDQLLSSKALRTLAQNGDTRCNVDVVVESAAQAMRHVATSVDEARHRQDIAIQSALIFTRICIASSSASNPPSVQALTPEFFASLGDCLLSGSLDVMHYHPHQLLEHSSNIKAKYFGAFLYRGGYLILVKVSKGKKYEPKHWFALADFEVSDVEDDGSWLPCSIMLSSEDQHFELAAACQHEKDTWLRSIDESLAHVSSWVNEPTPSFKLDDKGELLIALEEDRPESSGGLATIRSIPELGHISDTELSEPFFASLRHGKSRKRRVRYETPSNVKQDIPPPPSRRASSNSVKAIFSPMSSDTETVLIRRSSPAARTQVDHELQDVISQSILTARSYAFSHEVELFQAPKTGFSRSNSAIGMSRLSKHESVRVPRRRTTESLDSLMNKGTSPMNKSASGSRKALKLSVASHDNDITMPRNAIVSLNPSPPPSRPHSRTTLESHPINQPSFVPIRNNTPVKSRSFVRNVKGIFQLRPISPIPVIMSHPSQHSVPSSAPLSGQSISAYNVFHRWTKDSFRRRTRSVHDEPDGGILFDGPEKRFFISLARTHAALST